MLTLLVILGDLPTPKCTVRIGILEWVTDVILLMEEILRHLGCTIFFFPSNTWPCLIAAANYRQGTINRLAFFLTTAPHNRHRLCGLPYRLGCTRPCKQWDKQTINWLAGFFPSTVALSEWIYEQYADESKHSCGDAWSS